MLVWALVPWLNLAAVGVVGAADWAGTGAPPVGELLNRTAVSCAILLSLWGAARLTDDLRRVGAALTEVVEQDESDVRALFRGMGSTVAPLLLTATGVLSCSDRAARHGSLPICPVEPRPSVGPYCMA
jgi:hypothetical protein